MDDGRDLAGWLAGLAPAELAALVARRPDVLAGRPPATLGELAARLDSTASVRAAVRMLRRPDLQALTALCALGERRTRAALTELLAGAGSGHEEAVATAVGRLAALALVRPGAGERLEVPAALEELLPVPLGLGPPARRLWEGQYVDALRRAVKALGGTGAGRKAELADEVVLRLADPDLVRQVAARAPGPVRAELQRMAGTATGTGDDDGYLDEDPDQLTWARVRAAERWGVEHGLLVEAPGGYGWAGPGHGWDGTVMPAEVALALRGPDSAAPFEPRPPDVPRHAVDTPAVEAAAAGAGAAALGTALALLDRAVRAPVPLLADGAVGVREVARLARQLETDELPVRLLLELFVAGDLLVRGPDGLSPGPDLPGWRELEPADQLGGLLLAWWHHPGAVTESRDENGRGVPALRIGPCAGCAAARAAVLQAAAALPEGRAVDADDLRRLALWEHPLAHALDQDAGHPLRTPVQEAEALGVLAAGALSPLGAALLADDREELHEHLDRLLPGRTSGARFGSDLTAVVGGLPAQGTAALLDRCADRESSGGATTWRFSPASVRRAFDDGATADELLGALTALTDRELPQPLAYLVQDVARRHGRLRLSPVVSVVTGQDPALLAEVLADRRLAGLGLWLLAPTVLGCAVPVEEALTRLRAAGHFPVAEQPPQPPQPQRPPRRGSGGGTGAPEPGGRGISRPATSRRPPPKPVDVSELAARLVSAGDTGPPRLAPGTAAEVGGLNPALSDAEVGLLAEAVEDAGRVEIDYRSASGALTRRVIAAPQLVGSVLYAWCELRQDERVFTVGRILAVAPAP